MNQIDFKALKLKTASLLILDDGNIQSQLYNITKTRDSYLQVFVYENKLLRKLEIKRDEKRGELVEYFKFQASRRWEKTAEIESQINRDPAYTQILSEIEDQQEVVTYLEQTLESFKQLSFQINNHINWTKFQNGVDK
jgi:hypothetical protein